MDGRCRGHAAAIDNTLVIGHESGRVTFLELEGADVEE